MVPVWCCLLHQLSEVEVNGQIEQVCEQVYSEMQSQAMEAAMDSMDTMDTLPMPGCFRMRSHSYVRAIDQGCAGEEEGEGGRPLLLLPSSPPRTSATTVRTIQSSTGRALLSRNGCSVSMCMYKRWQTCHTKGQKQSLTSMIKYRDVLMKSTKPICLHHQPSIDLLGQVLNDR